MSVANHTKFQHDLGHGRSSIWSLHVGLDPIPAARLAPRLGSLPAAGRAPLRRRVAPARGEGRRHRTYAALVPEQPTAGEPTTNDPAAGAGRTAWRRLAAADPPTVPFAIGGMVVWAVVGLVLLPFRDTLSAHGHTDWLWICLAGFLLGFPGWIVMIRHDRRRAARQVPRSDQESPSVD